jgi:hypothetical protein
VTNETDYRQLYQRPGVRAWLVGDRGSWLVELGVAADGRRFYDKARLEVLFQPRGADGLAIGRCVPLFDAEVRLVRFPGTDWSWGSVALPSGFQTEHAQRCYLRFTPIDNPAAVSLP